VSDGDNIDEDTGTGLGDVIDTVLKYSPQTASTKELFGTEREYNPFRLMNPVGTWASDAARKPPSIDQEPDPGAADYTPESVNEARKVFADATTNYTPTNPDLLAKKGKGKSGMSADISYTQTPPIPPELASDWMTTQRRMADIEFITQQARAAALGVAVDVHKDLGEAYQQDYEGTKKQVDTLFTQLEQEKEGIRELIEQAKSNRINPNQFFANIGEAGKFAAAIAVGAGTMASAFGGGPNVAYDIVQRAIDRNVRAQLVNMEHGRALIAHQMNFVNTIRGLVNDKMAYGNYLRMALNAIAMNKFGMIRAAYGESVAQAAALNVYNKFNAAVIDAQIKQITNSAAKVTWHVKSMGQFAKAMALAQGAAIPRQQGMQGQARAQGAPPSVQGRGRAAPPSAQMTGPLSGRDEAARLIASDTAQYGQVMPEHWKAKQEQLNQLIEAAKTPEERAAAERAAAEFSQTPQWKTAPGRWDHIPYGTNKFKPVKVFDEKKYEANGDRLIEALQNLENNIVLDEIMRGVSPSLDAKILRDLGLIDGNMELSAWLGPGDAAAKAKAEALKVQILKSWHLSTQPEGSRNAMDRQAEQDLAERGSLTGITALEWLGDWMRGSSEVARARRSYSVTQAQEEVRRAAFSAGVWAEGF
jgi:hypothetical protein